MDYFIYRAIEFEAQQTFHDPSQVYLSVVGLSAQQCELFRKMLNKHPTFYVHSSYYPLSVLWDPSEAYFSLQEFGTPCYGLLVFENDIDYDDVDLNEFVFTPGLSYTFCITVSIGQDRTKMVQRQDKLRRLSFWNDLNDLSL